MSLLLEPYPVPDVYADGIDHVENLGNCFRTVYYVWARDGQEKLIVAKLVRPITSIITPGGALNRLLDAEPIMGMIDKGKRGH
jgi:hypothetical protein